MGNRPEGLIRNVERGGKEEDLLRLLQPRLHGVVPRHRPILPLSYTLVMRRARIYFDSFLHCFDCEVYKTSNYLE
jgi:hypothetical protein